MVFIGDQFIQVIPPPPEETPEQVHARAMERGAKCKECSLFGCGRGPVMSTIRPNAPLIAVGEAPGIHEVTQKRGFVGRSGQIVDQAMLSGGLYRAEVSVSNAILCMPMEDGNFSEYIDSVRALHRKAVKKWERQWLHAEDRDKSPKKKTQLAYLRYEQARATALTERTAEPEGPPKAPMMPQDACRPRLARDLAESNSIVELAIGKQALEQLRLIHGLLQAKDKEQTDRPKVASIRRQHGAPIILGNKVLMAAYHPAFAMRDKREYMPVIRENIARAARIAKRHGVIDWSEPPYILNSAAEVFERTLLRFLEARAEVTVDIETDGIDAHACRIRCVGLGAIIDGVEVITVVPFRHMDGSQWWDEETKIRLALLVRRIMDELPLIFQNGTYDTTAMLRIGLMTDRARSWLDTLILHHDTTDNDLPHDLGFITRRYFEVSLWKEDVDHKSVSNTSDYFLHFYCARDILATMRAAARLRIEIVSAGTGRQVATDTAMLPVVRDMSEMGLHVNEWKRGEFSAFLNKQCHILKTEFQTFAKRKVNPRSPPQLRELLYSDWGYRPVIATDGFEWNAEEDEDDDGSTSNSALTQLIKSPVRITGERGMDAEHRQAIDVLMQFRANDKLRGTYTDNLKTYEVTDFDMGWAEPVRGVRYDKDEDADIECEVMPRRRGLSLARTTFKGFVVPTGRLASGDPVNFQNIPKRARGGLNMRDMFVAPPGHVIVGADYAQIEARLYAVIAQDRLLLQAIRDFLDLHSLNCAALLAQPGQLVMEVYKWLKAMPKDDLVYWRTVAKRFCFLKIYGGQKQKLYSVMIADRDKATGELTFPKLKESECWEWSDNWDRLHPETLIWHERCQDMYKMYNFTGSPMIDFRRRFFPGGCAQANAIPNMTIQASAAAIANRALLALVEAIPFRKWSQWSGTVLQVHDYLAVVVPESRAYEAAAIVEKCMYYEYEGMKFEAEADISWTWGAQ